MTTYRPPSTTVSVSDNPRIINPSVPRKIPAIISIGNTSVTVTDEAVIRSTGSVDYVQNYPNSLLSILKVTNTPGITAGNLSYQAISLNGALYATASASITNPGAISWTGGGVNVPSTGSVYYVSYTYSLPATSYDPVTFYSKEDILNVKGAENTSTGMLAIGGSIVLENGSPGVILVQASGSSYNENNYKTAIDKLQKKDNVSSIVCLFPSGSVTRVQQESLINYAHTHVLTMNNIGRERALLSGSPSSLTASDGFDSIGDTSTPSTYSYRGNAIKNKHHTYTVPSALITRKDANGNTMTLDGNYLSAALAGVRAAQTKRSTPVHGFTLTGITLEDDKWSDAEMNQLGSAGCCVIMSKFSVVTVRDDITTDSTSADTQEPSVVDVQRLVQETLRTVLNNTYTNKGKVITSTTINDVVATTASGLQSLVTSKEISAYGKVDNPLTGETKIFAKQNSQEPRQIDVTCSYLPLYPLKYLSVNVSVYI
ncbi:MAG: hypothetical protein WC346_14155 [Methanogenium sp.]|jgi:hypothetical protein